MQIESVKAAYRRYAAVYDAVFGPVPPAAWGALARTPRALGTPLHRGGRQGPRPLLRQARLPSGLRAARHGRRRGRAHRALAHQLLLEGDAPAERCRSSAPSLLTRKSGAAAIPCSTALTPYNSPVAVACSGATPSAPSTTTAAASRAPKPPQPSGIAPMMKIGAAAASIAA